MANNEHPLSLIIRAVDKATGPLKKIQDAIGKATGSDAAKSVSGLGTSFASFGKQLGETAMKVGLATGLAAFGLYKVVQHATEAGDKLAEMSQRVGLGVDAYASLQYAAGQANIEQEDFNSAMDKFNVSLGQAKAGGGPLLSFLKEVSPALGEQIRKAKNTSDAFEVMARAFEKIKDPARRAALARAAFGKGGTQFGQFMGQGTKLIHEQQEKYLALAGSQERFAEGADVVNKAMKDVGAAFDGVQSTVYAELAPAILDVTHIITDMVVKNRPAIQEWAAQFGKELPGRIRAFITWVEHMGSAFNGLVQKLSPVIERFGAMNTAMVAIGGVIFGPVIGSIVSLAGALGNLSLAMGKVVFQLAKLVFAPVAAAAGTFFTAIAAGYPVMEAFNIVLASNPIGLVILGLTALAGAAYLVYKNWEPVKQFFVDLWGTLKQVVEALFVTGHFKDITWGNKPAERPNWSNNPAYQLPAPPINRSENRLAVDFSNAPRGTQVSSQTSSNTYLDLSVGYSMAVP